MADTAELIRFLDDLLEPAAFDDMCPNGLQVPGAREIRRVATGVTAQRALFDRATETFGVRRLGDLLSERFGVEHVWIDLPNPV